MTIRHPLPADNQQQQQDAEARRLREVRQISFSNKSFVSCRRSSIGLCACALQALSSERKRAKQDAAIEKHIMWLFHRLKSMSRPQKRMRTKTKNTHFRFKLHRLGTLD